MVLAVDFKCELCIIGSTIKNSKLGLEKNGLGPPLLSTYSLDRFLVSGAALEVSVHLGLESLLDLGLEVVFRLDVVVVVSQVNLVPCIRSKNS